MPSSGEPTVIAIAAGSATVSDTAFESISTAAPNLDVRRTASRAELEAILPEVDIIAGHIDGDLIPKATRLKFVHSWAAGPDHTLSPQLIDSPVPLTCSKGNGAVPLAEQAVLLMLMVDRDVPRWMRAQTEQRWDRSPHGELNEKTAGIIGLGNCGQDLAKKLKAFNMRVLGVRRTDAATPYVDHVYPRAQLHEFLAELDFLVVTAALTPETRGMLGAAEFAVMKPTAAYVCISRGGIADDDALLDAVRTGKIASAGLDAHGTEPLPPDSPFWTAPNTIITPHNGATTPQTRERGVAIFVDNLRRYLDEKPFVNVVDKQAGY